MNEAITFLIGLIIGYGIASILLNRKRFIVKTNEKGDTIIESLERPKQKTEFLSEMSQKQVEETEKSTSMQRFLRRFHKPAEEEEDEV